MNSSFKKMGLAIITTSLVACGNYHQTLGASPTFNPVPTAQGVLKTLDYASVSSIALQVCLNCHAAATGNADGINLESYASVAPLVNEIQAAVSSNEMPRGGPPLSAYQKEVLLTWISAGAPEESQIPLPNP